MSKKFIWVIGAVVIITMAGLAEAHYFSTKWERNVETPSTPQVCQTDAKVCSDGSSVGRSGPKCEFTDCITNQNGTSSNAIATSTSSKQSVGWKIEDKGENKTTGAPQTFVSFVSSGKEYPLGTYEGSCFEIDGTSWTLLQGEKAGVICWWAGAGTEFGIFEENRKLIVKIG